MGCVAGLAKLSGGRKFWLGWRLMKTSPPGPLSVPERGPGGEVYRLASNFCQTHVWPVCFKTSPRPTDGGRFRIPRKFGRPHPSVVQQQESGVLVVEQSSVAGGVACGVGGPSSWWKYLNPAGGRMGADAIGNRRGMSPHETHPPHGASPVPNCIRLGMNRPDVSTATTCRRCDPPVAREFAPPDVPSRHRTGQTAEQYP